MCFQPGQGVLGNRFAQLSKVGMGWKQKTAKLAVIPSGVFNWKQLESPIDDTRSLARLEPNESCFVISSHLFPYKARFANTVHEQTHGWCVICCVFMTATRTMSGCGDGRAKKKTQLPNAGFDMPCLCSPSFVWRYIAKICESADFEWIGNFANFFFFSILVCPSHTNSSRSSIYAIERPLLLLFLLPSGEKA